MRKCSINIKDKDYTIQINRESIVWLERAGFNLGDYEKKPIITIELLWSAGFVMNHPEVNPTLALKLMDSYREEGGDISEIVNFILEEYQSFISALSDTKPKKKATITEV